MKTSFISFTAGTLAMLLIASAQADNRVAKSYDIKDVTEVVAGGGCQMDIVQGDKDSLRIEAKPETLERIKVDQTGHKLTLSIKNFNGGFNPFKWFEGHNDEFHYFLQLKNLHRLDLSGACNAKISNWTGKDLAVYTSGASRTDFGTLTLENFLIEQSGASNSSFQQLSVAHLSFNLSGAANADVKAPGKGNYLKVEASGASNYRGKPLQIVEADLNASGASNIDVNATEKLKAEASGASNIRYLGQPKLQSQTSGASNINAIN
jgi:hypothetical protein